MLLLLIRQSAIDRISPIELLDGDDARHFMRQRQPGQSPTQLRPRLNVSIDTIGTTDYYRHFLNRFVFPTVQLLAQLWRTPIASVQIKQQQNAGWRNRIEDTARLFFDGRNIARFGLANFNNFAAREPREPFQILINERA